MPIIECFGLPGAGKTYLQEHLFEGLYQKDFKVISRDTSIVHGLASRDDGLFMGCVKKMPSSVWKRVVHEDVCLQEMLDCLGANLDFASLIFSILRDAQLSPEHARSILGAVSKTCVEFQLIDRDFLLSKVLVADEWFCHRFHTVLGNCKVSSSREQTREYVKSIPLSEIGVFIATPPNVCVQRMSDRKRYPHYLEQLSHDELNEYLEIAYNNFKLLVEELKQTDMHIITYDGISQDLNQIVQECSEIIGKR